MERAMRNLRLAILIAALPSSAYAWGYDTHTPARPLTGVQREPPAQSLVEEGDIALLLDYLRAALLAAAEGREPEPPPAALGRRAREIAAELRARGTLAALLALAALEAQIKSFREPAPPPRWRPLPPTVPYTPASSL